MDVDSYDSLLIRIKRSLDAGELNKTAFTATHFSSILLECNNCISLSLERVTKQLEGTNIDVKKICGYMEDATTILQMLSDFIKTMIESTAMACFNMKQFPTTTGNIILTVFKHCKNSECIYGSNLKSVETQLKDLFRTCHELQLTYLMTMEKHFIFDLTVKEQQDILLESLNINLGIAEIVQALDIKTMAEQWKAYTVLCEKYSNFLQDKNIYDKCTQLCASTVVDNIKLAMESAQDNKNIQRSLKVANFSIKIMLRVSNIFKNASSNNYGYLIDLLIYIYLNNPAYLDLKSEKSYEFINLVQSNIMSPSDGLCSILLQDEGFIESVSKIDVKKLEIDLLLGYTVLITSLIKAMLNKKEDCAVNMAKSKIIDCVYRILPLGHCWFNIGLKFRNKDYGCEKYFNLYEHLLVHMVALASTFNVEDYAVLERYMYEALLSVDCYSAMFSSNLWVMLTRISNDELVMITLSSLINIYQKLDRHKSFHYSPQEVHISYTIGMFFEILSDDYKKDICQQFAAHNKLWCIFKVCYLPDNLQRSIEAIAIENMKTSYNNCLECPNITENYIIDLIQKIKITATCSLENNDIEQYVVNLWSKVCHRNLNTEDVVSMDAVGVFEYLEALMLLTECIELTSSNSAKILHNMSTIMVVNTEVIILLFNLFCTLTFSQSDDVNQYVIEKIFRDTLEHIQGINEIAVTKYVQNTLAEYRDDDQFNKLTSGMFFEDLLENDNAKPFATWKEQLIEVAHNEFTHKCVSKPVVIRKETMQIEVRNCHFDLGDFLFDDDPEPSRKKPKLEIDIGALIERLENEVSMLCEVEETALTDDHKKRIRDVIIKLKNKLSA